MSAAWKPARRLSSIRIGVLGAAFAAVAVAPAAFASVPADPSGSQGNGQTQSSPAAQDNGAQANGQAQSPQPAPEASDAPGHNRTSGTSTPNPRPTSTGPGQSDHTDGNAGTSGSVNSPQPYSKADSNNTGANSTSSTNPYRSTRDGSPSGNGMGSGNAYGKPCAGCVGKADNKNPHGQQPNGTDGNAGYECDSNHGIGQTNPAHTGCTAPTQPQCVTNCSPTTPPPSCTTAPCQLLTPPTTPGSSVLAASVAVAPLPGVASVLGERLTKVPGNTPAVAPLAVPRSRLPFTGADVALLTALGVAMLVVGAVAVNV